MQEDSQRPKTALLLVQTGSPASPRKSSVKKYLKEFLLDKRVVTLPSPMRHLLVRGVIIPKRLSQSSRIYSGIWSQQGSPLIAQTRDFRDLLQSALSAQGYKTKVFYGMQYGADLLEKALEQIQKENFERVLVWPMFPQYSSVTAGSVFDRVGSFYHRRRNIPELYFLSSFYDSEPYLESWRERITSYAREQNLSMNNYHFLFTFHGLPVKEILSSDAGGRCLQSDDCCSGFREHNPFCYRAQCRETAEQLAQRLGLAGDRWSVSFQSRVGRRWLEPYTDKEVVRLAQEGKHLVVVAPSFVAENLETLAELDDELRRLFIRSGGRTFHRVPQLNGFEPWVRGSVRLLESRLQL